MVHFAAPANHIPQKHIKSFPLTVAMGNILSSPTISPSFSELWSTSRLCSQTIYSSITLEYTIFVELGLTSFWTIGYPID